MLELKNITKDYPIAGGVVHALRGISVKFRKNEFVSILGASGCGKTTLLNIIGGLDKYTSGDLLIQGVSTKKYNDRDWDTYRNHSIGFIFQSYHLIPHQTILQNVELALTISGVSKEERRQRAIDALEKVGLADKINSRPNQLSGGQAQRVAIARALINDPEIVLADEPTGALDSKTSVQIMDLLKEISQDRLVIMVTHNPELAEEYSTRIIRLKDGEVTDDSDPLQDNILNTNSLDGSESKSNEEEIEKPDSGVTPSKVNKGSKKRTSMSMGMSFMLSLKNLLSKGKRTAMVSVAGSIGIIGVSMVLAISAGVQNYITTMEDDMLSGYPVAITQSTYDFSALMSINEDNTKVDLEELAKGNKVYVNSLLDTLGTFATGFEKTNNISEAYVDYISKTPADSVNVIQYNYAFNIVNNIYTDFKVSDNLSSHFADGDDWDYNGGNMSIGAIRSMYASVLSKVEEYKQWGSMISTVETFAEIPDNFDYIMAQYDVLVADINGEAVTSGYTQDQLREIFESKETLVMVVSDYQFNDLMLAQYGYFTEDEFLDYAFVGVGRDEDLNLVGKDGLDYSVFVGDGAKKFTYYPNDSIYSLHEYKAKPQYSDDAIRTMMSFMDGGAEFAEVIINARNESNARLKSLLQGLSILGQINSDDVEKYYEMFRLPEEDETTEGYLANAYSTEYEIDDGDDKIVLPAFKDTSAYDKRVEMGVKLILQKKKTVSYGCLDTGIYYTNALTDYALDTEAESEIVKYVAENGSLDEVPCYVDYYYVNEESDDGNYILATNKGSIETGGNMMTSILGSITGTTTSITAGMLGGSRLPTSIFLYSVDFELKDTVTGHLDEWNAMCDRGDSYTYTGFDGEEHTVTLTVQDKITYTDTVGMIISMVNTMIQMITVALVAFTALALVVSTVMVGIITYVSVVERVKEIGILRAVGARKKDIKRLFNAETFIIGLAAGVVGIAITYLISFILNMILGALFNIYTIAALPIWQALIMIAISVGLTLISGLIPASAAAKKDPVVALRTE